jgi:hypothetical protein
MTINEVANELARRLTRLFLADAHGHRPVHGLNERTLKDPHFRDHVLFYEYFHGDSGRGVGAAHQTGWTGLVAKLLMPRYSAEIYALDNAPRLSAAAATDRPPPRPTEAPVARHLHSNP